MKKFSIILSVGILTLFMGGCETISSFIPFLGSDEAPEEETTTQPTEGDSPTAIGDNPEATPEGAEEAEGAEETEEGVAQQPLVASVPPTPEGLDEPIDPEQRRNEIQPGRTDPFAFIPEVQPQIIIAPPEVDDIPDVPPVPSNFGNGGSPGTPQSPGGGGSASQPSSPGSSSGGQSGSPLQQPFGPQSSNGVNGDGTPSQNPNGVSGDGAVSQDPNTIVTLPQLPTPTLAQNVEVTGVVQVGGTSQAIIQAPNESYTRYVQVGQYLSNGQVLVKRIDMTEGPEPIVILEQFGIEVAKRVGEKPLTDDEDNVEPT